jgi:hypothetical protein
VRCEALRGKYRPRRLRSCLRAKRGQLCVGGRKVYTLKTSDQAALDELNKLSWEQDIHDAARMDVRNFCVSESEFPTSKTMWMNRYFRPRGEFCSELLQKVHPSQLQRLYFRCLKTTARFNRTRSAFHPSLELRFDTSGGGTHHAASIRAQYSANAGRCLRPGATGSDRLRHGGRGTVKQIENGQQITDKVA